MPQSRRAFLDIASPAILFATAIFAILWIVARAQIQSMTLDEAETYLVFVRGPWRFVWFPASNNHVLNTLLIRLLTDTFGVSQLILRIPALVGGAAYIVGALLIARLISRSFLIQWSFFVCLVFNPLVLDYLAVARGYALAVGFLLLAVAVIADGQFDTKQLRARHKIRRCLIASCCLAFSFMGNFAFAFVDAAVWAAFLIWMTVQPDRADEGTTSRSHLAWRCGVALTLPGAILSLALTGYTLANWSQAQLDFGAHSIGETFRSVYEDSLYQVDPRIVSPFLFSLGQRLKTVLFPLLALFVVMHAATAVVRQSWRSSRYTAWLAWMTVLGGGSATAAFFANIALFHTFGLLLPKDRTALYFVPLYTLAVGAVIATPVFGRIGKLIRALSATSLLVLACYYLLCLRLAYIKEWSWDADVQSAYRIAAEYNHRCGILSAYANGLYGWPLNFYRSASGQESFPEFEITSKLKAGRELYILDEERDRDSISMQHLQIVYRGPWTSLVIALSPSTAARVASAACYSPPQPDATTHHGDRGH